MEKDGGLLYILSNSNTIPSEWESRLMYKGRMLAYLSQETGENIFPKTFDKEKVNELIADFGIQNLVGEEVLLLIEATDYDDFLKQISEIDGVEKSRYFKDYIFYM